MAAGEGPCSVSAAVDAQFGTIGVLLPYENFEDRYQDAAGSAMIAFPGGRDPHAAAGEAGYSADLQLGLPVPKGARIRLNIPVAINQQEEITLYRYVVVFRDRNIYDTRNPAGGARRQPWHYPKQGLGATDNNLVQPARLFPIDANYHAVAYEQVEPAAAADEATLNPYPEFLVPERILQPAALHADGETSVVQQGIYDPILVPTAEDAMRPLFWLDAGGDDMIVYAQKIPDSEGVFDDWDFDGDDQAFSNVFGRGNYTPPAAHEIFIDGGIRVSTGSNP